MRLVASQLEHKFADQPALFRDLNFEIPGGSLVAVTGPSGSGKSTLLSLLAGWVAPTAGVLTREGIDTVTWVPQNPYGVAGRSAIDHVAAALMCRGIRRSRARSVASRVLETFGLADIAESRFAALSGGEGQRLMLARASLTDADLLLVDEPTAQLDPVSSERVIATLGALADRGRIVAIATHDPRVKAVCPAAIELGGDPA